MILFSKFYHKKNNREIKINSNIKFVVYDFSSFGILTNRLSIVQSFS